MTEKEVLAVCSQRKSPTIRATHGRLDREGRLADPAYRVETLIGETYIESMTCFSKDTGLAQVNFAPPPLRTVTLIAYEDYQLEKGVPLDRYLTGLTSRSSSAVSQAAESIGQYAQQAGGRLREHYGELSDAAR